MHRHRRAAVAASLVLLLVPAATAFGYTHGAERASTAPGDTVTFRAYLFGSGTVEVIPEQPAPGWTVEPSVDEVDLSTPSDYPYRYMTIGGEARKVVEVGLAVTPPADASGSETVRVAFRSNGGEDGTGIGVSQVQEFAGTVDIVRAGGPAPPPLSAIETAADEEDDSSPADGGEDEVSNASTGPETGDGRRGDMADGDSTSTVTANAVSSPVFLLFVAFQVLWIAALIYVRRRGW